MSAHILCHSNDILPNTFPPPRPSARDHGMVSEYEPAIIMNQTSLLNQSGISVELDSDITPKLQKPTPSSSQQYSLRDFYDPALCVTPDKPSCSMMRLNRGSDEGISLKPRNSQKVRFDNFVEVKRLSPDSSPSQDLAVHRVCTDTPPTRTVFMSDNDDVETNIHTKSHTEDKSSEFDVVDPVVILASDLKELSTTSRKSVGMELAELCDKQAYALKEKPEHVLARPEFCSTLQVQKVVKEVEEAELDIAAAIKQKLKESRKLKSAIIEKVTSKVNTNSPLFEGLVSTEPCEDDLVLATEKQKTAKVKPAIKSTKPEDNIVHAPNLLEYLTPDLLQETASLSIPGIVTEDNGPKTADLARAFDVYRHIRTWEGW